MKNALKMVDANGIEIELGKLSIEREQIAKRAFEKWQQRGCPLWDAAVDWYAAERELAAELLAGEPPREPTVRRKRSAKQKGEPARSP
jgi:hypothetical protein